VSWALPDEIRTIRKGGPLCQALSDEMVCTHDGYHSIQTMYDRRDGELVFFWTCERCGARLSEAKRVEYRPAFHPGANRPTFATDER
jgi:hypothetical protein